MVKLMGAGQYCNMPSIKDLKEGVEVEGAVLSEGKSRLLIK